MSLLPRGTAPRSRRVAMMLIRGRSPLLGRATRRLCTGTTVSVDVSRLPRRPEHAHVEHTGLLKTLATAVRVRGPMSIKEFMTSALTHPRHGYYMQQDEVFGRQGDFVTSPEVSQVFGELIGIWCVASWEALGKPERVRLVEMGPGKGTLMADVLRSTAIFGAFQAALRVDLVEVSTHLRAVQRETLAAVGSGDASAAEGEPLLWRPQSLRHKSRCIGSRKKR